MQSIREEVIIKIKLSQIMLKNGDELIKKIKFNIFMK
jgi:hypothetical protein